MKNNTRLLWPAASVLIVSQLAPISYALAQDESTQSAAPTSEAQAQAPEQATGLTASDLTFRPQAGAILFEGNQRLSSGLLADIDFFKSPYANVGISAGGLYSGLNNNLNGASGFSSGISRGNNTYMVQVPMDVKFDLFPGRFERWTFGPHLGANVIYSSSGVGNAFGTNSSLVTPGNGKGSTWNAWFDAGPEVNYALTSVIDLGVRYDATFASAFKVHTLTLGVGFKV
ncbi:MAG: hypothetical protein P4M08_01445 [Oligoflexia bacterium]|nr:hypothetical protein [Oligoflexia bacterium]